jgi:hypothetical protein
MGKAVIFFGQVFQRSRKEKGYLPIKREKRRNEIAEAKAT